MAFITRLPQAVVMAAIVATLMCAPLAAGLGALSLVLPHATLWDLLTFGGRLGTLLGPLAWWSIAFVGALAYAAFALPGED
jgi:hypothetical protein